MVRLTSTRIRSTGFAVSLAILGNAAGLSAAWTHLPLVGGDVRQMISPKPGVAYAGTFFGGVYMTADRAVHWQDVNSGFDFEETLDFLVADPTNSSILYGGGGGDGTTVSATSVSRTTDGGAHWAMANSGLSGGFVGGLAVDPFTPQVLYCGVTGFLSSAGFFKSTNSGTNWTAAANGLPKDQAGTGTVSIYAVAADSRTKLRIYALTASGLYLSTDGGANWAASGFGLQSGSFVSFESSLNEASDGDIYAAGPGGVYRSTDSGAHFTAIGNGLPQNGALSLAADPRNPSILLAGEKNQIFRSTARGSGWVESDSGLGNCGGVNALVYDAGSSAVVYAGTDTGAFVSTDGGSTWKSASAGIFDVDANRVAADAAAGTIFVSSVRSIDLSTDAGATFRDISADFPAPLSSPSVAVLPENPGTLLVGSRSSAGKPAIFRSTDSGGTWQIAFNASGCSSLTGFATDPANPLRVFSSCSSAAFQYHLQTSTDGGGTWKDKAAPSVDGSAKLAVAGGNPSTLLLSDTGGVQASTDGGATFRKLTIPGVAGSSVVSVAAIGGGPPGLLYASAQVSSGVGVFRSTDAGAHWSRAGAEGLPEDVPSFSALATDPDDPDVVYGAAAGGSFSSAPTEGFFRSSDGGATWERFDDGLDTTFKVPAMLVSADGSRLLAGTSDNGLLELALGSAGRGSAARGLQATAPARVGKRP